MTFEPLFDFLEFDELFCSELFEFFLFEELINIGFGFVFSVFFLSKSCLIGVFLFFKAFSCFTSAALPFLFLLSFDFSISFCFKGLLSLSVFISSLFGCFANFSIGDSALFGLFFVLFLFSFFLDF